MMDNFIQFLEQYLSYKSDLSLLYRILSIFLEHIKSTSTVEEAQLSFKVLEDIQFILAKAFFKKEIILPPNLVKFISDFDRVDDEEVKNYLYSEIKSTGYSLERL